MDARPASTAVQEHPATPPRARGRAVPPLPERDVSYAHLALDELRSYRRVLSEEEHRVSYWRRILQARLDLLHAGLEGRTARPLDAEALQPVLADARVGAGRQVLVRVLPTEGLPPLPSLEQLWQRHVDPADRAGLADLEQELSAAERQLSEYRSALHRRISAATDELIARYRQTPSSCLAALPLPPARAARR